MLILLSVGMRFFSFFPTVIDHDESTYIVIAEALMNGDIYLKDVIDTKPIGIFLLFGLFQTLFGKSIIIIRIITAIWIALTAWMVYNVHRQLVPAGTTYSAHAAPIASAIIYVALTSVFTFFGVSPNTELFISLFSISALYIVIRQQTFLWIFLAGLLLGIGFMIKYVVLFDAIAIGLFFVWLGIRAKKNLTFWFSRGAVMVMAFLLPFAAVWFYYWEQGMSEAFLFYSFEVSGRYFISPPWYAYILYLLDCFFRFLPVALWFLYCSWQWRSTGIILSTLTWVWGGLVIFVILLPGKLFPHYYIQFMLPLSLMAGSFFDHRRSLSPALEWIRKPVVGYSLLAVLLCTNIFIQKEHYYDKRDYPLEVAAWLNGKLKKGDLIYTGNYHQIVYHLTHKESPTPYVHRSLLWNPENAQSLMVDPKKELAKILMRKPRFILLDKSAVAGHPLFDQIQSGYSLVHTFDNKVRVYEKI